MYRSRRIVATLVSGAALVAGAGAAAAEDATVTITGGVLSVDANNVALSGVALDGTDKISESPALDNTWTATDPTGSGGGWNLTIESTDFSTGGPTNRTVNISDATQEFRLGLLDADVTTLAGNTAPGSLVNTATVIPEVGGSALKFLVADADEGMGSYSFKPSFSLEVPAFTYAGTYTATITVSVNSGP